MPPVPPPTQQEEPWLPTLAPTAASPKHAESSSQRPQTSSGPKPEARKQPSRAQLEPKRSKHALEDPDCDQSATKRRRQSPAASGTQAAEPQAVESGGTWFLNYWLGKYSSIEISSREGRRQWHHSNHRGTSRIRSRPRSNVAAEFREHPDSRLGGVRKTYDIEPYVPWGTEDERHCRGQLWDQDTAGR